MTGALSSVVVAGLCVSLGDQNALTDINISVESGDFLAIVGPNGSGKSTLLKTIAGDLAPTSGSVAIDGLAIQDLDAAAAASMRSYLPQAHVSNIPFDVRTVVGFGAFISDGIDASSEQVSIAMRRVGIDGLSNRSFSALSGGEQRRVTIARVLCQAASVMLLDEPTDSLDLGHADAVMAIAAEEAANGRVVLSTSHNLNVAARHATRMLLLDNGRIARMGAPTEVLDAELLSHVYGTTVRIIKDETTGSPIVLSG
ncbi:MAG: ATP-binding cassette domain-containing protein [Actinomycetota bacterium]|nr:ATP-binding cassette domain-containing protein [Actinomycetota bacterium]